MEEGNKNNSIDNLDDGANEKPNCNYGTVNIEKLPMAEWAQNLTGGNFYFKKGYTAFHIFLRLLGNFFLGSTVCYNFLTGKKQNFNWCLLVGRLTCLLWLGCFIARFFTSCSLITTFAPCGLGVLAMSVFFLFYCAVITVKAAKMINENGVYIYCCRCHESHDDYIHNWGLFKNYEDQKNKCNDGHDKTLPMVISLRSIRCEHGFEKTQ